jgi:hypothetical protein
VQGDAGLEENLAPPASAAAREEWHSGEVEADAGQGGALLLQRHDARSTPPQQRQSAIHADDGNDDIDDTFDDRQEVQTKETAGAGAGAPLRPLLAAPAPAPAPYPYPYHEVVRGRAARDALRGFPCAQCAAFWSAMLEADPALDVTASLRAMQATGQHNHGPGPAPAASSSAAAVAAEAHPGTAQGNSTRAMLERASRHRARFSPVTTPPGYWELGSLPLPEDTHTQPAEAHLPPEERRQAQQLRQRARPPREQDHD